MIVQGEFISLLHWIEAQDSQNSLNSLVLQCSRAMDQINLSFLPRVQEEVDKVKQSLQAPGMLCWIKLMLGILL